MAQSDKWRETRKSRMDRLFEGRKYEVVEEVHFDEPVATPLGYKVKNGYRVSLVSGEVPEEGNEFVVGKALLHQMSDDYQAVDKPVPKKRGRPRKQPLEQAEQWATRDMPNDAEQVTQPGPTYTNPNENEEF